jgi:hypothetical protein
MLKDIAYKLGRQSLCCSKEDVSRGLCPTSYYRLIQLPRCYNPVEVAEKLLNDGMHAIDVSANCKCINKDREDFSGTPLWGCAGSKWSETSVRGEFDMAQWLVAKGADLNSTHHRFRTMPVHILAEKIFLCSLFHFKDYNDSNMADFISDFNNNHSNNAGFWPLVEYENFCNRVLRSTTRDGCLCACSEGGCGTWTVSVNTALHALNEVQKYELFVYSGGRS